MSSRPSSSGAYKSSGQGGEAAYTHSQRPAAMPAISQTQKDYSPYGAAPSRPSSAGANRSSSRQQQPQVHHQQQQQHQQLPQQLPQQGSVVNYARNVNQAQGAANMYMNNPISVGLLGTGMSSAGPGAGGSSGGSRPSSAGHARPVAGQPTPTFSAPQAQPVYSSGSGGSSRPKSAGVVRRADGSSSSSPSPSGPNPLNIMGSSNIVAQQQMYYQQQQQLLQQQLPIQQQQQQQQQKEYNFSSTSTARPSANDHWSTSYKLHYGYSNTPGQYPGAGAQPTGSALQMAASAGAEPGSAPSSAAVPATAIIGASPSSSSGTQQAAVAAARPTSATTNRIRSAVDNAQKFAAAMATEGDDEDHAAEAGAGLDDERGEREMLNRDDDDEMDGKPFDSRSHPEVSTTTPSHSIDLNAGSIDMHNGRSLDSLPEELIEIGLSTVPNQFCAVRDALELKKLLLMSKGSRGGIVPSSTAVMDMYMVGKVVGVGSYGKVRAAWHRLTGSKVAIKTYDKSKLKDPAHWKRVHSEIKIMEQVSHPRIARMYEAVETPKRMHLIMECLDGGNLCSYVKAKRRLSEDESRRIFFQIMQAIEYLHMLGVTHRDVKLENVLFADNKDIKLIDFGFSTVCQAGKRLKVFCGTPSYMAPEIVRRTEYEGKPVDMWSLGILLYALLCGCFPFRAKSYPDLYRRIARGTFAIPEELSVSVKDLLRQLLTVDVSQRINSHAALRHPWLQMQLATTPDVNKLRLETLILISDKPSDDIDEQTLAELEKFGIMRDEVIRLILTKTHSSISTLYYLLLELTVSKRRLLGKRAGGGSSSSGRRAQSSHGGRPDGRDREATTLPPASLGYTYAQAPANRTGGEVNQPVYTLPQNRGAPVVQQQQQQQQQGGGDGYTLLRPRSASSGRPANSGPARPLSAFAGRR